MYIFFVLKKQINTSIEQVREMLGYLDYSLQISNSKQHTKNSFLVQMNNTDTEAK
jgi:Trm5-related predicted tRNA methylase